MPPLTPPPARHIVYPYGSWSRPSPAFEKRIRSEGIGILTVHRLDQVQLRPLRLRIHLAVAQVADHLLRIRLAGIKRHALIFRWKETGPPQRASVGVGTQHDKRRKIL